METLETLGDVILHTPLWPWFDFSSFTLTCLMVRDDYQNLHPEGANFARRHPLATYIASLILSTGGGFLGNMLLGNALLLPYEKGMNVIGITIVWYLLNYCPLDAYYRVFGSRLGKYACTVLKEVHRVHKVLGGVQQAAAIYPHGYAVIFVIGTVKGAGANILRVPARFLLGLWTPQDNELLKPTLWTKMSALSSLLFLLQHTGVLQVSVPALVCLQVALFQAVRFGTLILRLSDPCAPLEGALCWLTLGGLWQRPKDQSDVNHNHVITDQSEHASSGGKSAAELNNNSRQIANNKPKKKRKQKQT